MKTWKRKCALFLVFTMIMTLSPIGEKNAQAQTVKKTVTVKVGKTKKLFIVGGQKARKIKWSVKNKKIARIIKKSKKSIRIKGLKAGSTLILGRAYIGGKIKKLKIKVKVEKASKKEKELPLSTKRPIKTPAVSEKSMDSPGGPIAAAKPIVTTEATKYVKPTATAKTTMLPDRTAIPQNTEEPSEMLEKPGLYDAKTKKMKKTWDELIDAGTINLSTDKAITVPKEYTDRMSGILVVKDGVESIGEDAFFQCEYLTEVQLPDSITSIGSYAFWDCNKLTRINIPEEITSIEQGVFFECSALEQIQLPYGVESIGAAAFHDCTSLRQINLPDTVMTIENSAFFNCSSLTEIQIPDGVNEICRYAFSDCSSLTEIQLPQSVITISEYAFFECKNLTEIQLSEDTLYIGDHAFYGCSNLLNVRVPENTLYIGELAFSGVSKIIYNGSAEGSPWGADFVIRENQGEEEEYDAKEDYDLLGDRTTILPKGKVTAENQSPLSTVDTFRIEGGKLIGTYNAANSSIVLDLGGPIDMNRYKGVEISGICPGSIAIEFYDPDFDMFVTKDNGYDRDWWETTVGKTYPFYRGTSSWRYENGGMNRLKAIQNGFCDDPNKIGSAKPTEERIRYSLADMTDEKSSGDWSNVRYIIVKSNNNPYLPQMRFSENNPLQYQITGFKLLAEEVIDARTEAHYLMYDAQRADTEKNVAFKQGNISSYYVDKITDTNPADQRDTTKNLSDFRFVKVKVSEGTRSVKVGLVTDGKTVADTRIIGQETGAVGDIGTKARSVYVSLEGIEKDILKNVDQITVEADGGKVTWLSATKGVINYSKAGKKLEDKVEITMDRENQGKFIERQVTASEDGDEGA